jgi:hypothetical protein
LTTHPPIEAVYLADIVSSWETKRKETIWWLSWAVCYDTPHFQANAGGSTLHDSRILEATNAGMQEQIVPPTQGGDGCGRRVTSSVPGWHAPQGAGLQLLQSLSHNLMSPEKRLGCVARLYPVCLTAMHACRSLHTLQPDRSAGWSREYRPISTLIAHNQPWQQPL